MRVLLLKDVYKLGRAGDVKKVADGYGRNYLLPQGMAVLATPGAVKQAVRIRVVADDRRVQLNQELGAVAEKLEGLKLAFPVKAGETGKLYGSITTAMIAAAIQEEIGVEMDKRQIDAEPIKMLGVHSASVQLTIDLIPTVTILIHRDTEPPESAYGEEVSEEPTAEEIIEAAEALEQEAEHEEESAEQEAEIEDVAEPEADTETEDEEVEEEAAE